MIITSNAYQDLLQVQSETRCKECPKDLELMPEQWGTKFNVQLGILATHINDNAEDDTILANIIKLAELVRSYFSITTQENRNFIHEVTAERKIQDELWGPQNHSRLKWFLLTAEEVGKIAAAIDLGKPDSEIATELIHLSAVLQAWVTKRDWFYPPQTSHTTICKSCGKIFQTLEDEFIKCHECNTYHNSSGNKLENYNQTGKTEPGMIEAKSDFSLDHYHKIDSTIKEKTGPHRKVESPKGSGHYIKIQHPPLTTTSFNCPTCKAKVDQWCQSDRKDNLTNTIPICDKRRELYNTIYNQYMSGVENYSIPFAITHKKRKVLIKDMILKLEKENSE